MKIGVLGTGLMGFPLALRLIAGGHRVFVFNRSRAKAEPLAAEGAVLCDTASDLIENSDTIVTMLSDAAATRDVLGLGNEAGPKLQNKTVIQMATIAPGESRALAQDISRCGGDYFESPVLGSTPEAKSGNLILMVGASPEQFATWQELLRCFGPSPRLIGPVGAGASVKLAMNQLIAALTVGFSESLAFVRKEGVDVERFMSVARESALYAKTYDKKLTRMLGHDFAQANFPTKHLLKDVRLFAEAAKPLNIDTQTLGVFEKLLETAVARGFGDGDYCAVYSSVEDKNVERP